MRVYTDQKTKDYKSLTRLSLIAFLCELPNLIITTISALVSNTPVVLVDTINSLGETLHCLLVYIVTKKLQKNNEEQYNYGVGRVEALASFVCDSLVVLGMLAVLCGAIYGIINPTFPSDNLFYFILVKISATIWDLVFLIKALNSSKKLKSKIADSEVRNYIKVLSFDVIVGIIVALTYFFRKDLWICYVNPIVSIILVIVFLVIYFKKIVGTINELTDKSIPITKQDEIFDIILENKSIIKKIKEVNCRYLNNTTYVEIGVIMHDNVTYKEQSEYLNKIKDEVSKVIENSVVKIVID